MSVRALFITSALLLAVALADQSTCKAIWLFQLPCSEPVRALVNQVKAWSTQKCKDSQEKCGYEIISELPRHLEIRHTSPSTSKTTTIIFNFDTPAAPAFCKVMARSTAVSQDATKPNDFCLMYNLIDGSGLTRAGYKEICTSKMCPSKTSATCSTEEEL